MQLSASFTEIISLKGVPFAFDLYRNLPSQLGMEVHKQQRLFNQL